MIKVLHIGVSANPGGVESMIINYHRHINNKVVQFNYLDIYGNGVAFKNEILELNGRIYTAPNFKKHPVSFMRSFKTIVKNNEIDILHIHMQSAANILPIKVGLIIPEVKIICHSHSSSTPKGIFRKLMHAVNLKRVRNYNTNKWACGIRAGYWMWGDDFDKKNIIPNAINLSKYKFNREIRNTIRKELGFDRKKIIGFVGRFGNEKNTLFLIEVLKELLAISKDYLLLTVGGNGEYEIFRKKLEKENLDNNYYSAGIQTSTENWYQIMDAFLLPSFFEGFPMVGVEAQASGLPCFFSNRISEEIDITQTISFLPINNGDARIWANAINEKISGWNRDVYFPKQYCIEEAAKNLENKYLEVMY